VSAKPTVLFACIHNSGRSVAAEALARHYGGDAVEIRSAGSEPGSDVVVTMGCGETCPVFPGKQYDDWKVDDPAGQDIDTVRRIVAEIDERVQALLRELPLA
jgi:arsenate reductase